MCRRGSAFCTACDCLGAHTPVDKQGTSRRELTAALPVQDMEAVLRWCWGAAQDLEKYNSKLSDLEQRVHDAISKGHDTEEMHKLETRLQNVHSSGGGQGQLKELEKQVEKATH